jgi:hypothetical protein
MGTVRGCLFELRAWVRRIQNAIEKHTESRRQMEAPPDKSKEVCAVISFDDETIRDAKGENERQYRTQRSIKRATWSPA